MNKIVDLFGHNTGVNQDRDWAGIVAGQHCPFVDRPCYKTRKSQSHIAIGTCTVAYRDEPVMICPLRLLERRQIFIDCFHLLTGHEPGNEMHVISEVALPGGSLDYILASVRDGKVRDFVGIELQTLDTIGTVWPDRQRFIASKGLPVAQEDVENPRSYGMNWKMTAKTILVQLHHKIQTLEAVNKHLVLVIQDHLLNYMRGTFSFDHLVEARTSDPMHFHAYSLVASEADGAHKLKLATRLSTDCEGVARALNLQSEAKVELEVMLKVIEQRLTDQTRFDFDQPPPPVQVTPEE